MEIKDFKQGDEVAILELFEIVFKAKYMTGSNKEVEDFIKNDKNNKLKKIYEEAKENQKETILIGQTITEPFWN